MIDKHEWYKPCSFLLEKVSTNRSVWLAYLVRGGAYQVNLWDFCRWRIYSKDFYPVKHGIPSKSTDMKLWHNNSLWQKHFAGLIVTQTIMIHLTRELYIMRLIIAHSFARYFIFWAKKKRSSQPWEDNKKFPSLVTEFAWHQSQHRIAQCLLLCRRAS